MIFISLKGSFTEINSFSSARDALVFAFKSIIRSMNLKRFSNLKEVEPIFFIKRGKGFRVAPFRASKYSL